MQIGVCALAAFAVSAGSTSAFAAPQRTKMVESKQIADLIRDAEERSGALRRSFGRTQDNNGLNGPRVEQAKSRVRDMDEALKRMRYLVGHNGRRTDIAKKLNEAVSQATALHMLFEKRMDLYAPLANDWYALRRDLDELARWYGVPGVGE
jgi:hypothetical protein